MISRLYRKAEFDLAKAQRGIVLLDGMDRIGENAIMTSLDPKKQQTVKKLIYRDISKIIEGTKIDVSRAKFLGETTEAGPSSNEGQPVDHDDAGEVFDTSMLFFVCFGVSENFMIGKEASMPCFYNPTSSKAIKAAGVSIKRSLSSISSSEDGSSGISHMTVSKSIAISVTNDKKNSREDSARGTMPEKNAPVANRKHSYELSDYSDDEEDYDDMDDYLASIEEEEKELANLMDEIKNVRLPQCQQIWGINDVKITLAPEALETIANQVS